MKLYKFLAAGLLLLSLISCNEKPTEDEMPRRMMLSTSGIVSPKDSYTADPDAGPESVYVCKSSGASRYHYNENCSGMKRCKHKIEKTTVKKAEAVGLTRCKLED